MTSALTPWTGGLLAFCVLTDMARELNFKAATLRADRARYVLALATNPFLWLGIAFWAVEVVAWLVVLEHVRLAIAFPIMALTYAATPLGASLVLGETLSRSQRNGALLVAAGVVLVSLSDVGGAL